MSGQKITKYLFSDIDGTLFKNYAIDKETLHKIKKFIKAGNKFYLATGRMDADIKFLANFVDIQLDYRISQNGAVVKDKNDNIIYKNTLPKNLSKEIAKYLFTLENVRIEVSTLEDTYCKDKGPEHYAQAFIRPIIIEKDLENMIGNELEVTVFVLQSEDENFFLEVKDYVNKSWGREVQAIMTSLNSLEIMTINASKGEAIKSIVNKYSIPSENVFVVGDQENDISMFKNFENSFAMKEAKAHVASYANYATNLVGDVVDYINDPKKNSLKIHKKLVSFKNSLIAYVDGDNSTTEVHQIAWEFKKMGAKGLKTNNIQTLKNIKQELNIPVIASCCDITNCGDVKANIITLVENGVDIISFNISKLLDSEYAIEDILAYARKESTSALMMATIYSKDAAKIIKDSSFDIVCINISEGLTLADISEIISKLNKFIIIDGYIENVQDILYAIENKADSIIIRLDTQGFNILNNAFEIKVLDSINKIKERILVSY